jgi:hypothetical protein
MKQVSPSVVFSLILCVLIGYFEPANAAKSLLIAPPLPTVTNCYVAMNSTTATCPFWPNPISSGSSFTAISYNEVITGGSIQAAGGSPYPVSVIATDQPFPMNVVETNQYFPVDEYPYLTGTTISVPALAVGSYVLIIKTQSGDTYTTKVTITK